MSEGHPNADDLHAKVFKTESITAIGALRRWTTTMSALRSSPARTRGERAIDYARDRFRDFDEIELAPYGG